MTRPRLRQPNGPAAIAGGPDLPPAPTPFTLAIAGIVVTRAQLVAALQPFVPGLSDIEPFEDGERFLFVLKPGPGEGAQGPPTQT